MTEHEWLTCRSAQRMLEHLCGKATGRKLRLFALAWCRRQWFWLPDERSRQAVEIGERYADGLAGEKERLRVWEAAQQVVQEAVATRSWQRAVGAEDAQRVLEVASDQVVRINRRHNPRENAEQCDLLRDIFGNPFRPAVVKPAWLLWNDGCLGRVAQYIYHERRFRDLPILADALEEAGCDDADVLAHCRSPKDHVLGCWVVDRLLGKA